MSNSAPIDYKSLEITVNIAHLLTGENENDLAWMMVDAYQYIVFHNADDGRKYRGLLALYNLVNDCRQPIFQKYFFYLLGFLSAALLCLAIVVFKTRLQ
jgi:hypothetical protein